MADFAARLRKHIRLTVQLCFTALTNGYVKGFTEGTIYTGKLKNLCVPGLNCYSCPGALGACPLGSLQSAFATPGSRLPLYLIGFFLLVGSAFGRFVCGWLCPFGLIQDLLYKIPFFRKRKNLPGHRFLKWLKYAILAGFVILLPLFALDAYGIGAPYFCKYICPSGTFTAGLPLALLNEGIRASVSCSRGRACFSSRLSSSPSGYTGHSANISAPWELSTDFSTQSPSGATAWTKPPAQNAPPASTPARPISRYTKNQTAWNVSAAANAKKPARTGRYDE